MNVFYPRSALILGTVAAATVLTSWTATAEPNDVPAAVPSDVRVSASVSGSTVTATVINDSGQKIFCGVVGYKPRNDPATPDELKTARVSFGQTADVEPGARSFVFDKVNDGDFILRWFCGDREVPREPIHGDFATKPFSVNSATEPIRVTVSAMWGCLGPLCIPKLGFFGL